jgi:hypothetical protein
MVAKEEDGWLRRKIGDLIGRWVLRMEMGS